MKTKLVCCIAFITLTVGFSQENEDKYALTEIRSSDELEYEKFSYNLDWLLKTSDIMLDDGMRIKDSLR